MNIFTFHDSKYNKTATTTKIGNCGNPLLNIGNLWSGLCFCNVVAVFLFCLFVFFVIFFGNKDSEWGKAGLRLQSLITKNDLEWLSLNKNLRMALLRSIRVGKSHRSMAKNRIHWKVPLTFWSIHVAIITNTDSMKVSNSRWLFKK